MRPDPRRREAPSNLSARRGCLCADDDLVFAVGAAVDSLADRVGEVKAARHRRIGEACCGRR